MTQFPAIFDRSNIEQHQPLAQFTQTKAGFGHRSRSIAQNAQKWPKSLMSTTQMSPDRRAFNQLSDQDFSPFARTKHNFSSMQHGVIVSPSNLDIGGTTQMTLKTTRPRRQSVQDFTQSNVGKAALPQQKPLLEAGKPVIEQIHMQLK